MDPRLYNVLRDLHVFCCISNLAYQTTRKLSPKTYNEVMISILYRLTHLSFESDPLQEAIRIGLLAFSSTIFMQRQFMKQPYRHLLDLYNNSLSNLHMAMGINLPVPISLWLAILLHVVIDDELSIEDWQTFSLEKAIFRAGIDSWPQASEILRSVAWVAFIHDRRGKQAFEAVFSRLQK